MFLESDGTHTRGNRGAVKRRRARQRHGVTSVVDLGVVILDPADHRVCAQRRKFPPRSGSRQVTVMGQDATPAEMVVEQDARTDIEPLPTPVGEREEKRNGPHEVRTQVREQQRLFATRLANQAEVELLEIAEPPVDQLARPTRSTRSEIALLDECNGEPPRCGIESCAATGDTAADDRDIERFVGQTSHDTMPLIGV
jgi:hypothetical protein